MSSFIRHGTEYCRVLFPLSTFACDVGICSYVCRTQHLLQLHKLSHLDTFKCRNKNCCYKTGDKRTVIIHSQCLLVYLFIFLYLLQFNVHIESCNEIVKKKNPKVYKCKFCEDTFLHHISRHKHQLGKHPEEYPVCPECFDRYDPLVKHV